MGDVKRISFKKRDMCLMATAVIRDRGALDFITAENMAKWGQMHQKDGDDKAVEATRLSERLCLANHIAYNYNEQLGLDGSTFPISLFPIRGLPPSNELRQLELLHNYDKLLLGCIGKEEIP